MLRPTLLLLLAAQTLCLAACKKEPDLPADPHVPLMNPFIGVWNAGGEYWQFSPDGTGGRAAAQTGPFLNTLSFFVYAGQDVQTTPSKGELVILEDTDGSITVTRYDFSIAHNQATLTQGGGGGVSITLDRISGEPQPLSLTNPLIGEWSADWTGSEHGLIWSLKYRADGTVKVYHHQAGHQFENAYALRRSTLVIFGYMRFSIAPVIGEITQQGNRKWQLQETQTNPGAASWVYTKVDAAEWL